MTQAEYNAIYKECRDRMLIEARDLEAEAFEIEARLDTVRRRIVKLRRVAEAIQSFLNEMEFYDSKLAEIEQRKEPPNA